MRVPLSTLVDLGIIRLLRAAFAPQGIITTFLVGSQYMDAIFGMKRTHTIRFLNSVAITFNF